MTDKNVGGRPTKYKKEYDDKVYKLCLLGCTNDEIVDFFGISLSTFDLWRQKHKGFRGAIESGKIDADARVAKALFHRALGYSHKAVKFATFEGQITDSIEYVEHYPPDTKAASLWLRNRQPKKWQENTENKDNTGKNGITLEGVVANKNAISSLLMPQEGDNGTGV